MFSYLGCPYSIQKESSIVAMTGDKMADINFQDSILFSWHAEKDMFINLLEKNNFVVSTGHLYALFYRIRLNFKTFNTSLF